MIDEGESYVVFKYPLNSIEHQMPKKIIKKITYANGVEKYIEEQADEGSEDNWERVEYTYNKKDVEGLFELGDLYAKYESDKLKYKIGILEKSAIIVMKRKAARQNADIILIEEKKEHKGYGELPYVELWGKGYAYTK